MAGRLSLLAALAGAALAHLLVRLPERGEWLIGVGGLLGLSIMVATFPRPGLAQRLGRLAPLWAFALGLAWVSFHIDLRLAESLRPEDEDRVSRVVLRIDTLVREQPGSRRFEARVLESKPSGIPQRILVSWHAAEYAGPYGRISSDAGQQFPELVPGQVWRMSLNLRTPHGLGNPHGFDYENHVFAQGVRAVGSVRGTPRYLYDRPWASLPVVAERARHVVRKAMAPYLDGKRYGPVLLALAIGDQAAVAPNDWLVFNRTSISHLVAISGSHITMIAALGGLLALWLWKRLAWRGWPLAERMPAQVAACLAALAVAWLYCLLAGWGVPARRTFLMLCMLGAAHLCRLPLGPWRVLLLAAVAVVAMDPWALTASGFWLSFGAVAVLLTSGRWLGTPSHQMSSKGGRMASWLWAACKLQLTVTAGLMPILALLFNEVSIVSPLANAYAIPIISLVVTPFSLLLAAVAMAPGLDWAARVLSWLAHEPLRLMMAPTRWLAELDLASLDAPAAPAWTMLIALAGLAIALMPRGLPYRGAGWALMLPALLWRPEPPPDGGWDMLAIDVGQGSAILVQTARHALLFDTGIRYGPDSDAALRSIVPLLRAKGVGRLDVLVVSHADIDHAGGLRSVLETRPVGQLYSSFDAAAYLRREAALLGVSGELPPLPQVTSRCRQGAAWKVDGVAFDFVWPAASAMQTGPGDSSRERNAHSCVLRIRGRHHFALLTGDIGVAQETELVRRDVGPIDVLLAAHHGSRSSSSADFIEHTGPLHVIAQAGRWNRYGHPHPTVQRNWEKTGAQFWRTDLHGAITIRSRAEGLAVEAQRESRRRY